MSTDAASSDGKALYEAARRELVQALTKKRAIDKTISSLDSQIYNLEAAYLTETATSGGNIIHGFENYLKNQPGGGGTRRRFEVGAHDHIFSSGLDLGEGEDSFDDSPTPATGGGLTTVLLPPATRLQEQSAAAQKKERDRLYQRRKRASFKASTASGDEYEVTPKPTKRRRLADDD